MCGWPESPEHDMATIRISDPPSAERRYFRHAGFVRITHWINAACFTVLLMSGLQIFNAHPALYVGDRSDFDHAVLSISRPAFPGWITLPSVQDLATGRRWHFFCAWALVLNGAFYFVWGFLSRHFFNDLLPSPAEFRHIGGDLLDHLRLRFRRGLAAKRYNVLQKLSYLLVIFALFPLAILTGLTMSPGIDSAAPQLLVLFGGRQTARLIHFAAASGLALFVIIHLVMVLVSGVWNNLRSMMTGWYDLGTPGMTDVE
jgi:thiosulfate reductase cytochrome b subunit